MKKQSNLKLTVRSIKKQTVVISKKEAAKIKGGAGIMMDLNG